MIKTCNPLKVRKLSMDALQELEIWGHPSDEINWFRTKIEDSPNEIVFEMADDIIERLDDKGFRKEAEELEEELKICYQSPIQENRDNRLIGLREMLGF